MKCRICEETISTKGRQARVRYCSHCGNPTSRRCKSCGMDIHDEDIFCPFCGCKCACEQVKPHDTAEIKEIFPAGDDTNSGEVADEGEGEPTDDVPY